MRFLVDESVHRGLAEFLRSLGHDVTIIGVDYPPSTVDLEVLAIAVRENRVLVSSDSDFGELVFADRQAHVGVVLLRLRDSDLNAIKARMNAALRIHPEISADFVVVTLRTIRRRA